MTLKLKGSADLSLGPSISLSNYVPPLLHLSVARGPYPLVVYWRVKPDEQPKDRLMVTLDAQDGRLIGIECTRVTPQAHTFDDQSFEFLADGADCLPIFDLTPWRKPDARYGPIPTIEVSQPLSLRVGATAFSIQIGEAQEVNEVVAVANTRLGFTSKGELVRIDSVDLSSDRMAEIRSWLDRLDDGSGIPPTPVTTKRWEGATELLRAMIRRDREMRLQRILEATRQLRYGAEPQMEVMRAALRSKNIDVAKTICMAADDLLDSFIVVVVLPDQEVLSCSLSLSDIEEGAEVRMNWHETTGFEDRIALGLEILEQEQGMFEDQR
jgi:hypothetical protein